MQGGSIYHILLYHGVHGNDVDVGTRNSSGKHISRARFEAQMEHLAATRSPVSMGAIAAAHRGDKGLPDAAVAVTFDDGFLNNYTDAWPVLERHQIPATFYLATGYIGTGLMMWSDLLEFVILTTGRQHLGFADNGRTHAYELADEEQRVAVFQEVKALCKALPNARKDAVLDQVRLELNVKPVSDHPLYAFMEWDQVREMNASPLVDFGAHSVDHVSLAKVPRNVMRDQIDRSVATVVAELDESCTLFSYPEGQPDDYDADVIAHLKRTGFDHAPTAIEGVNAVASTDPFQIHRTMVGFEGRPYPFADL